MGTSHTTATTDSCVDTTHSSAISGWKDEVGNVAGVCTLHEAIIAGTGEFGGINIRTKTIEICLCNGANVVAQHGSKSRTRPKRIPRGGGCSSALLFSRSTKTRSIEAQSRYAFNRGIRAIPRRHLILGFRVELLRSAGGRDWVQNK